MKIGELSRRTGISVRMLRFYEGEGLLSPARTTSGYRIYGSEDVQAVETIRLLGAAGMTLPVIRRFLPCSLAARGAFEPCDELRDLLRDQIAGVDARMGRLADSRDHLERLLAAFG